MRVLLLFYIWPHLLLVGTFSISICWRSSSSGSSSGVCSSSCCCCCCCVDDDDDDYDDDDDDDYCDLIQGNKYPGLGAGVLLWSTLDSN